MPEDPAAAYLILSSALTGCDNSLASLDTAINTAEATRNELENQESWLDFSEFGQMTNAEAEVLFVKIVEHLAGREFRNADTENWFAIEPLSTHVAFLVMPEAGIEGEVPWEIGDMQVKMDMAEWGYEGYLTITALGDGTVEVTADSEDLARIAAGTYSS